MFFFQNNAKGKAYFAKTKFIYIVSAKEENVFSNQDTPLNTVESVRSQHA